jgi:hypothetical protein
MSPRWGSKPRSTDRLVVGRNVTLTWILPRTSCLLAANYLSRFYARKRFNCQTHSIGALRNASCVMMELQRGCCFAHGDLSASRTFKVSEDSQESLHLYNIYLNLLTYTFCVYFSYLSCIDLLIFAFGACVNLLFLFDYKLRYMASVYLTRSSGKN